MLFYSDHRKGFGTVEEKTTHYTLAWNKDTENIFYIKQFIRPQLNIIYVTLYTKLNISIL